MKKYSLLSLLILPILFFISCQNEDVLKTEVLTDQLAQKELVSLKTFNENRLLELKVNWESMVTGEMNGVGLEEWTISEDKKIAPYSLIRIDNGGDSEMFFVLHYRSNEDIEHFSYIEGAEKMTRTVNWMNLEGEIVALEAFKEGRRINLTKSEDMEKTSVLTSKSNDCGPGTAWKSNLNQEERISSKGDCSYGFYATVIYTSWTEWFYDRGSAGWEYAYRTDERRTYAREWVSTGSAYAAASSIYGGSVQRVVNASNGSRITNIATLEIINADTEGAILVPSCRSFEYADGITVKAAGVTDISEYFYWRTAPKDLPPGHTPDVRVIEIGIPISYFTLPKGGSNGWAANRTATALEIANVKTQAWFLKNGHWVGDNRLQDEWVKNIRNAMRLMDGDFGREAPFRIRSPAPYREDFSFWRTNCS